VPYARRSLAWAYKDSFLIGFRAFQSASICGENEPQLLPNVQLVISQWYHLVPFRRFCVIIDLGVPGCWKTSSQFAVLRKELSPGKGISL